MSAIRLLDLVLPPACAACGLPGGARLQRPAWPPWRPCPSRGARGAARPCRVPVARCPACRGPIEGARQAVAYTGPATALVAALKDQRRRGLATVLAEVVVARVPRPPDGATLVPVPLGRRRSRERGFNQSALLARELGRRWALPVSEPLVRVREAADQRGARASARARQVAGRSSSGPAQDGAAPAVARGRRAHHGGDAGGVRPGAADGGRPEVRGGGVRPCAARGGLAMIGVRSIGARIRPAGAGSATSSLEGSERGDRAASGQGQEHVRHRCPVRPRGAEARPAGPHPAAVGRGHHGGARAVGGAQPQDRARADRRGHGPHQGAGAARARERGGHVRGHRPGRAQAGAPGPPLPRPAQGPRAARDAGGSRRPLPWTRLRTGRATTRRRAS